MKRNLAISLIKDFLYGNNINENVDNNLKFLEDEDNDEEKLRK